MDREFGAREACIHSSRVTRYIRTRLQRRVRTPPRGPQPAARPNLCEGQRSMHNSWSLLTLLLWALIAATRASSGLLGQHHVCALSLVKQTSHHRCVSHNYGCLDASTMAVAEGCGGLFECSAQLSTHSPTPIPTRVRCRSGSTQIGVSNCSCGPQRIDELQRLYRQVGYDAVTEEGLIDGFREHPATSSFGKGRHSALAKQAKCLLRLGTSDLFALLPLFLARAGSNATYLEIGANDGVLRSQTYALDACLGWSGVLVEAAPAAFTALMASPRQAFKVHAAACSNGRTVSMVDVKTAAQAGIAAVPELVPAAYMQRWGGHMMKGTGHKRVNVSCRELGSILDDAAIARLNYISVDVQGAEDVVLQTVNLRRLDVVLVEEEPTSPQKNERVRAMLLASGFVQHALRPIGVQGLSERARGGNNVLYAQPGTVPPSWSGDIKGSGQTSHVRLVVDALAVHSQAGGSGRAVIV